MSMVKMTLTLKWSTIIKAIEITRKSYETLNLLRSITNMINSTLLNSYHGEFFSNNLKAVLQNNFKTDISNNNNRTFFSFWKYKYINLYTYLVKVKTKM